MNILFVDQFSELGGAQLCLRDLIPEVLSRGWTTRALLPGNGPLFDVMTKLGVNTDRFALSDYSNGSKTPGDLLHYCVDIPRAAARIRKAVRAYKIDAVYVNGPRILPAAMTAPCTVVFHMHSRLHRGYTRDLVRWSVRRIKPLVLAMSHFVAEPLAGIRGVQVVDNGVGDYWQGVRSFGQKPWRIGIIGRIAPEKGQLDFLKAAAEVVRLGTDVRFTIFGDALFSRSGYLEAVQRAATGLPVEFRGWTDDIGGALRELDLLAVPSEAIEGGTRVIPEALSAGTPVVAYPCGGIPEMIEDGVTGLLASGCEPHSLAETITSLIADPAKAARIPWRDGRSGASDFRFSAFSARFATGWRRS